MFAAYLLSDAAACFVGQVFPLSGGWVRPLAAPRTPERRAPGSSRAAAPRPSAPRPARATHQQLAVQHDAPGRAVGLGDALQQQLGRRAADLVGRLGDHGDRGVGQRRSSRCCRSRPPRRRAATPARPHAAPAPHRAAAGRWSRTRRRAGRPTARRATPRRRRRRSATRAAPADRAPASRIAASWPAWRSRPVPLREPASATMRRWPWSTRWRVRRRAASTLSSCTTSQVERTPTASGARSDHHHTGRATCPGAAVSAAPAWPTGSRHSPVRRPSGRGRPAPSPGPRRCCTGSGAGRGGRPRSSTARLISVKKGLRMSETISPISEARCWAQPARGRGWAGRRVRRSPAAPARAAPGAPPPGC